jgi:Xaa-Pro dipeptidase
MLHHPAASNGDGVVSPSSAQPAASPAQPAGSPASGVFATTALPGRLCNLDRLLHAMKVRGLDGIVATTPANMFYLTSFNAVAHKSDEPRPYAVVLSRHAPEHPIIVIADYYLASFLARPTWVEDIRPFRAIMMPLDLPARREDIDRFIPQRGTGVSWLERARSSYVHDMATAMHGALRDLKLDRARVGFDDVGFGLRLGAETFSVEDGCDALMFARAVKTPTEIKLLERATRLNEAAITRTVACWQKGATWRDLNTAYAKAVVDLGGFVRDPGGMVWGHPRGADAALFLATGIEDDTVEPGTHVMFDCHGTIDLYCWDGGKTWVVEGEPQGGAKRFADATAAVTEALLSAMRPGARISELQAKAREVYRRAGVPDPAAAVIFFHGLGLSHYDIEQRTADGKPNGDWILEDGMVVPVHLLYPGGEHERCWLEEVVAISQDGGRPLFSWGFSPLTSR